MSVFPVDYNQKKSRFDRLHGRKVSTFFPQMVMGGQFQSKACSVLRHASADKRRSSHVLTIRRTSGYDELDCDKALIIRSLYGNWARTFSRPGKVRGVTFPILVIFFAWRHK